ncbi:FecR family protein [Prolixibacteraceae bacterium JC049]|nr:FecR family protein [Prolixibacteraceae bacterium JC049]
MDNRGKIDFSKIWMHIHSKNEDSELDEWRQMSKKNEAFYSDVEEFYHSGNTLDRIPIDSQKSLRSINRKIDRRRFWRFTSSVAAMVVIAFSVYFFITQPFENDVVLENAIKPGNHRAVLVLNNGKEINLSADKEIKIQERGADIKSDGKTVEYQSNKRKKKKKQTIIYNTLKVPRGGTFYVNLSDGTRVWLNAQSELRYPVQFTGKIREVTLVGEALFEVTKNESMPFVVKTEGQTIKVLGTSFNVSAYSDNQFVKTTLITGKVQINTDEKQVELKPSFQSVLNKSNGDIVQTKVETEFYTCWKDGEYYFENVALDEIFKTLSRWYDFQYEFLNESAEKVRFSGSFDRQQDFENIISIIQETKRVKINAYENKLTIN